MRGLVDLGRITGIPLQPFGYNADVLHDVVMGVSR
jgi:hypothetical protein